MACVRASSSACRGRPSRSSKRPGAIRTAIRGSRRCWCRWWSVNTAYRAADAACRPSERSCRPGELSGRPPRTLRCRRNGHRAARSAGRGRSRPVARRSSRRVARLSDGHRFSRDAGGRPRASAVYASRPTRSKSPKSSKCRSRFLMDPAHHEVRVFRWEGGERRFFAMPYPPRRERRPLTSSGARRPACCATSIAFSRHE